MSRITLSSYTFRWNSVLIPNIAIQPVSNNNSLVSNHQPKILKSAQPLIFSMRISCSSDVRLLGCYSIWLIKKIHHVIQICNSIQWSLVHSIFIFNSHHIQRKYIVSKFVSIVKSTFQFKFVTNQARLLRSKLTKIVFYNNFSTLYKIYSTTKLLILLCYHTALLKKLLQVQRLKD